MRLPYITSSAPNILQTLLNGQNNSSTSTDGMGPGVSNTAFEAESATITVNPRFANALPLLHPESTPFDYLTEQRMNYSTPGNNFTGPVLPDETGQDKSSGHLSDSSWPISYFPHTAEPYVLIAFVLILFLTFAAIIIWRAKRVIGQALTTGRGRAGLVIAGSRPKLDSISSGKALVRPSSPTELGFEDEPPINYPARPFGKAYLGLRRNSQLPDDD